jgi:hypothetical protein
MNQISDISIVASFTGLEYLWFEHNLVSDISALVPLTNLKEIDIGANLISDLLPLVQNDGFGEGDRMTTYHNPLSDISTNTYIPELKARGVTVMV